MSTIILKKFEINTIKLNAITESNIFFMNAQAYALYMSNYKSILNTGQVLVSYDVDLSVPQLFHRIYFPRCSCLLTEMSLASIDFKSCTNHKKVIWF